MHRSRDDTSRSKNHSQNKYESNVKSILIDFHKFPLENDIYGYCELNAEFQFIKLLDFEKNLINKFHLPYFNNAQAFNYETNNKQCTPNQPLLKNLMETYTAEGLLGVCKEIATDSTVSKQLPAIVQIISNKIIQLADFVNAPINQLIFNANEHKEANISDIRGDSWTSSIKALKWHPIQSKFAIAFKNDSIQVYGHNASLQNATLKHHKQIKVTCLAWKPFNPSILAVGCANLIVIWDIDIIPVSIKPSSSCSYTLSRSYHNDIIDIQWDPKTDYLYSLATKDNQIMIWDTALKQCTPVKRVGNYGFTFSKFCSNGLKLMTSDLSTTFRVWNTSDFSFEKWSNLESRVTCAAWSPCGKILLFACADSTLLYSIYFHDSNKQEARVECDLSQALVDDFNMSSENSRKYCFGGIINEICWDPNGERLAITFKKYDNEFSLNVVATFLTKNYLEFQLVPCGLILDPDNQWPSLIQFKPHFEYGSLLTIVWSNGRIEYVPFCYSNPEDKYGQQAIPSNIGHLSM